MGTVKTCIIRRPRRFKPMLDVAEGNLLLSVHASSIRLFRTTDRVTNIICSLDGSYLEAVRTEQQAAYLVDLLTVADSLASETLSLEVDGRRYSDSIRALLKKIRFEVNPSQYINVAYSLEAFVELATGDVFIVVPYTESCSEFSTLLA